MFGFGEGGGNTKEWGQECWSLVFDEETVDSIILIDSISMGDGSIPHTPLLGVATPQTPAIKCKGALFNFRVCNVGCEPIGRKEGKCRVKSIWYGQPSTQRLQ